MSQHTIKQYYAIVLGGTGGVGAYLVEKLLASSLCAKVTVISRKELSLSSKLKVEIWNNFSNTLFHKQKDVINIFKNNDVVFCCLGAPESALIGLFYNPWKFSKMFRKVDYEYVVEFAKIANIAGVTHFSVISSPTANPNAKFIYSKIKGEMEEDLKKINFSKLSIFHPWHLMKVAKKNESRWKKNLKNSIAFIAKILPAKQKAILVEDVAEAMKNEYEKSCIEEGDKVKYYHADNMRKLVNINKIK